MNVSVSPRSAFFFLGRLEPSELANFNVQNVLLRDRRGGVVELLGHGIAVWWPSQARSAFSELLDSAMGWFTRIASSYYLLTEVALQPSLIGWVEAVDVDVREAVVGITDPRFLKVPAVAQDDPANDLMQEAIAMARRIRDAGELERATSEILRAGNDGSVQALLSAFRALECVRRIYEPAWGRRRQGWVRMQSDLGVTNPSDHDLLSEAAEAIRHGDTPPTRRTRHPVNRALRRRVALIAYARRVVAAAVDTRLSG